MRAIVLAAGRGTRLGALTAAQPKCLVPVRGASILERLLDNLEDVGIDDVTVVTGFAADRIAETVARRARAPRLVHNARFASTNMVASLLCASPLLIDDDVLLVYGDIVLAPGVLRTMVAAELGGAPLGIAVNTRWREYWQLRMADPLDDAETLRLSDGCVVELGERPRSYADVEGQYMGLVRFDRALARTLDARVAVLRAQLGDTAVDALFMTALLQRLIDDGVRAGAVLIAGGWLEIDTPADLAIAEGDAPYVQAVFATPQRSGA